MTQCDTNVKNQELEEHCTFYERVMSNMRKGESREEFAARLGVGVETLNRWSQGARPTQAWRYVALAERLECSAAWLYAGRGGIKPIDEGKEEEHGNDEHGEQE